MMLLVMPAVPERMAMALPPGAAPAMVACRIVTLSGDDRKSAAPGPAAVLPAKRAFIRRPELLVCARPPPLPAALLCRNCVPVSDRVWPAYSPPPLQPAWVHWLFWNRPPFSVVPHAKTPPPPL